MSGGLTSMAFLLPDSNVEVEQLAEQLQMRFTTAKVQRNGDRLRMQWGDWRIEIVRVADEAVFEECREMAAYYTNDPLWQLVGKAVGRLEVFADSDPEDQFYNEWLLVSEFLSELTGVLVHDPMLGDWIGNKSPN